MIIGGGETYSYFRATVKSIDFTQIKFQKKLIRQNTNV